MGSTLPPWETLKMAFQTTRPYIPMYTHLLLSALFPIYTGAYASLSRPSSAAKPVQKNRKNKTTTSSDDDDDDEQEQDEIKMEGLSPKDAITLPLTAGCVLGGLYFLIKRYGADLINLILGVYFSAIGIVSVAKLLHDGMTVSFDFLFPTYFTSETRLWRADWTTQKMLQINQDGRSIPTSTSTPPSRLWMISTPFVTKYTTKLQLLTLLTFHSDLTLLHLLSLLLSLATILYTNFISKPWPLTNLQGFAVSYSALQLLSPTSFTTGSLILAGLFAYDIWAVFFTPLMVTVATKLDQPIKLVFPRPDGKTFGMLGLGDIVLPGMMIALALRFDLYVHYLKKQTTSTAEATTDGKDNTSIQKATFVSPSGSLGSRFWTSASLQRPARLEAHLFPKTYFTAAMVGYVVGMLATLGVMSVFQHAQPALLYLVPGVLGALWGTGAVRGEVGVMWGFSEALGDEEEDGEGEKKKEEEVKDERSWGQWVKEEVLGFAGSTEKGEGEGKEKSKKGKVSDTGGEVTKEKKEEKNKKEDDVIIAFSITRKSARSSSSQIEAKSEKTIPAKAVDGKIAGGIGDAVQDNTITSSPRKEKIGQDEAESEEDAVIV